MGEGGKLIASHLTWKSVRSRDRQTLHQNKRKLISFLDMISRIGLIIMKTFQDKSESIFPSTRMLCVKTQEISVIRTEMN